MRIPLFNIIIKTKVIYRAMIMISFTCALNTIILLIFDILLRLPRKEKFNIPLFIEAVIFLTIMILAAFPISNLINFLRYAKKEQLNCLRCKLGIIRILLPDYIVVRHTGMDNKTIELTVEN